MNQTTDTGERNPERFAPANVLIELEFAVLDPTDEVRKSHRFLSGL